MRRVQEGYAPDQHWSIFAEDRIFARPVNEPNLASRSASATNLGSCFREGLHAYMVTKAANDNRWDNFTSTTIINLLSPNLARLRRSMKIDRAIYHRSEWYASTIEQIHGKLGEISSPRLSQQPLALTDTTAAGSLAAERPPSLRYFKIWNLGD